MFCTELMFSVYFIFCLQKAAIILGFAKIGYIFVVFIYP